jgi:hypothetical protein
LVFIIEQALIMLKHHRLLLFIATLVLIGIVTLLAPIEKTLGTTIRMVYLHGAWVWTAIIALGLSALVGLLALLLGKDNLHAWSQALGRTWLCFWLTYLPMSLWVQMLTWGGVMWDEPRWIIPLRLGIAGLALQAGLSLVNKKIFTSAANAVFAVVLGLSLFTAPTAMHPDSPIQNSDSSAIKLYFALLLTLILLAAAQVAYEFYRRRRRNAPAGNPDSAQTRSSDQPANFS